MRLDNIREQTLEVILLLSFSFDLSHRREKGFRIRLVTDLYNSSILVLTKQNAVNPRRLEQLLSIRSSRRFPHN